MARDVDWLTDLSLGRRLFTFALDLLLTATESGPRFKLTKTSSVNDQPLEYRGYGHPHYHRLHREHG